MKENLGFLLILVFFSYGLWLAKTYYDLWQNEPIMDQRLAAFGLLFTLSLTWPVVVPISYIELLKQKIAINQSLHSDLLKCRGDQSGGLSNWEYLVAKHRDSSA